MTKFREHRGSLDASLATEIPMPSHAALLEHCQKLLTSFGVKVDEVKVEFYAFDRRLGRDGENTYIVTVPGYGVIGFTDGN